MAAVVSPLRASNIAVRSAHIGSTGVLLGGHFFGIVASRLLPILYVAILTGAVLAAMEIYPNWRGLFEVRTLVIGAKLLVLCCIPFLWDYRVTILLVVLVLASAGSHMPRRLRHFSIRNLK